MVISSKNDKRGILNLLFVSFAVCGFLSISAPAYASNHCWRSSDFFATRYISKMEASPEALADIYIQNFVIRRLDRDTKEIYRLVVNENLPVEIAADTHIEKYLSDKPLLYKSDLKNKAIEMIGVVEETHAMIIHYESVTPSLEYVKDYLVKGAERRNADVGRYVSKFDQLMKEARKLGFSEYPASVMSTVLTFNVMEVELQTAGEKLLPDPFGECALDLYNLTDNNFRREMVTRAPVGQHSEEFIRAYRTKNGPKEPPNKFQYYTHVRFGANYADVRPEVWEEAQTQ